MASVEATRPRRGFVFVAIRGSFVRHYTLIGFVCLLATLLLLIAPFLFVQDSWMTLLVGREIVERGLPHHEALTLMAQGRGWTDQQWLAQLIFYSANQVAGLNLTVLVHVVALTVAFGSAVAFARLRGASPDRVLLVIIACLFVAPWSWQLRAQSLALPLFVWTLGLTASDVSARQRRTFLVLPLLVLWANIHGSVLVGAALVSWAGMLGLGQLLLRRDTDATPARSTLLLICPWVCVLVSPYGLDLVAYYRLMLVDSPVADVVKEWQAPTPHGYFLVFFAFAAIVSLVTVLKHRRLASYDLGVLALTLIGSLQSTRGIVWFVLATAILLPRALGGRVDTIPPKRRLGQVLAGMSCATLAVTLAVTVTRGDDRYSADWSPSAAQAVADQVARLPEDQRVVFADDTHADWLLWRVPQLRGQIVNDVRFELLDRAELNQLVRYKHLQPGWSAIAKRYPLIVLDPIRMPDHQRALQRLGARVTYSDPQIVVLKWPPADTKS